MNKITITLICLSVFLVHCKKEDTNPASNANNNSTTNATQTALVDSLIVGQFTGNLDGTDYNLIYYQPPVRSTLSVGIASNNHKTTYSENPDSTIQKVFSTIYFLDYSTLHITSLSLFAGKIMDTTQFLNAFPDGNYPYSSTAYKSIEISYYDSASVQWSTALGSADQSLSSFNRKFLWAENSNQNVFFSATFNCTLYNKTGQSKRITNGYYLGYFTID